MLEEHVVDISHNMSLLMVALASMPPPLKEVGGSKSKFGSDEKLGDNEDLEKHPKKDPKKEEANFQFHHSFTTSI
jgi:hypothetical protein